MSVISEYADEVAVVRSMLSILRGKLVDRWQFVDSPHADLLVLGAGAQPTLRPQGTQVVTRLLGSGEPALGSELTLERPVRAMPFMEFLNAASLHLRATNEAAASDRPTQDRAPSNAATLAHTLATLRKTGTFKRPMALLDGGGKSIATINTNRGEIASAHSLEPLLALLVKDFKQAQPLTARDWEAACHLSGPWRLDRLSWRLGMQLAQSEGLAFWLRDTPAFRLIGWPDFGAIGNDRAGMRLSAQLTQRTHSIESAMAATGLPQDQVFGFLNATSLCGLLVDSPSGVASARPAAMRRPEQASVIERLRAKLGLRP